MFLAIVLYRLGWLLVFLAVGTVSPAIFALMGADSKTSTAFVASGLAAAFCGIGLILALRGFQHRESLPVALTFIAVAWFLVPVFAALPLYASGVFPVFIDAYFEAVSAVTTTGATLLDPAQPIPQSILIWRAILQWLGGLGTLVMTSVIFVGVLWPGVPITNVPLPGARQSGGLMERLSPAFYLILPVYLLMTLVAFLLFWVSGVPVFDAFCLALSALSTGGMMPGTVGTDAYTDAPLLPWILAVTMALAGLNVMLIWYALRGRFRHFLQDAEAKHYTFFLAMAAIVCLSAVAVRWMLSAPGAEVFGGRFEDYGTTAFLAVSLVSTAGFVPDQATVGSVLPSPLVLALVAVGGSVISTAGGAKVIRVVLLLKHAHRELARLAHPHGVARVLYANVVLEERLLAKVGAAGISMLVVFAGVTSVLSALGLTFEQATAAAITAMSNCGPAFAMASNTPEGFRALPELARAVTSIAMIFGRLEVLILIGVINPMYWRRM